MDSCLRGNDELGGAERYPAVVENGVGSRFFHGGFHECVVYGGNMGGRARTGAMEIVAFGVLVCFLLATSSFLVLPTPAYAQSNSPPRFSDFLNNRTVAENLPNGSPVGAPIPATDPDGDSLYYALANGNLDMFTIDSRTGQLRTKVPLDYENKPEDDYWVHVSVRDGKGPDGATDLVADDVGLILITVENADDPGTLTLNWTRPEVWTELEAALEDPDGDTSSESWQWSRSDSRNGAYTNITTATLASYTVVEGDVNKYLRVTVTYTDPHGSGKSAEFVLTHRVRSGPQTNNSPSFTEGDSATRSIVENTPPGVNVGSPVRATNSDNQEMRYSLGGHDADSFAIVSTSGQLQTKADLDYEGDPNSYTVTVTATDTGSDTASISVTINIIDQPVEIVGPSSVDYSEDSFYSSNPVAQYTIEPDNTDLTLSGPDARHFSIAAYSGLDFKERPDYEAPRDSGRNNVYNVTINAATEIEGTTHRATKNVSVRVTNYNEGPVITGPDHITYVEHTTGRVGRYTARDPENDPIRWTVQHTDDWEFFQISRSGVLTFVEPPDYESLDSEANPGTKMYDVVIVAYSGMNQAADGKRISVTVEDAENDPPVFFEKPLLRTRSIPENTAAGVDIGDPVTARDTRLLDTSPQQPAISYTLVGAYASSFAIDSATGQLRTKAALDYERKNSYRVRVRASNGSRYSDGVVTINVENVDEEGVVGFSSGRLRSIMPRSPGVRSTTARSTVARANTSLTATLSDPDGGVTGVTWQWQSSSDKSTWTDIRGATSATYTPVEDDVNQYLQATVDYTDGHGPGKNSEAHLSRAVRRGPNRPPQFPDQNPNIKGVQTAQTREVAENTPANTDFGAPVTATDEDNDPLTYSLYGRNAASFAIDSSTGQLRTKAALDYERKSGYSVAVRANDGTKEGNAIAAIAVTINVTNEDDAGTVTLSSAAPRVGASVSATLSDPDGGVTSVTWQWATATAATSPFNPISGATSASYTPVAGDVGKYLWAEASYNDGHRGGKTSQGVSDNAVQANAVPAFGAATATRNVAENTPAGRNIGAAITATDADGDTLTYSLGGTDAASFAIVASTGQLRTSAALDYETKNSYTVTVTAADTAGGSGSITVTINVTDVNEPPTFDDGTAAARSIAENTAANTNIGARVAATDVDGDTLTYSLGGTNASSFAIVAASGQLQTKADLDYEAKSSYRVTVRARDASNASSAIAVIINVTNVEEAGTVTLSAAQAWVGTALTATLADPDGSVSSTTWQWERSATQSGSYAAISGATSGTYTPVASDVGKYLRAKVAYIDGHEVGKNAVSDATGAVQQPNRPPAFPDQDLGITGIQTAQTRTVAENTATSTNIGAPVAATDADSHPLTYSLEGTDAASFTIVASSGQLRTKAALDYERKRSYRVTVRATDTANTSATATVTINITNVEEAGAVTLSSAQPLVGTALTATLTDPDGSISSTVWKWEKSTNRSTWSAIASATSRTYTPVAADENNYLRVAASYTDGHGPSKTTREVSDHAVRMGNHPPGFPDQDPNTGGDQKSQTRTVAENTPAGRNIGGPVTATDADNDRMTYTLGGTNASSFAIVATSGQLQTKAALDYETKNSYTVTVTATDTSNASDTASVTINVTDVDEPGVVTLSSSQPWVDSALTATLSDPDAPVTGVSWQWAGSSAADGSYTNISGATSASYTPVAADGKNYLRVTASYTDGHGPGKTAQKVSDHAVRMGNRPPSFPDQDPNTDGDQKSQTKTVAENTPAGQDIGSPVTASDDDNDTLTYTLGGTNASSFAIVAASGQLQTKAALNYEVKSNYTVTVTATDTSNASDTITVAINVTDVDEDGTVTLSSSWPRVGAPFTATLGDPDATVSGVTWVWESSSNQNSWTTINGATAATYTPVAGVVGQSLRAAANYTDKFGAGKSALAVSANAVQQNTVPDFGANAATRSVAENTPASRNIGAAVAATDADTSKGDRLTYRLGGTDAASFAIAAESGQLRTKAALDHEAKSGYTVTVTATDLSNASDTVTVTITVTDVNEPPGKPAAPAVTAASSNGNTTLSATWTAPSNSGRPAITGYDLQYRAGTSGAWTDGPQNVSGTSAQVSGLTADTAYQVRVRAKNDEGDGAWSDPGGGTTTRAVSRPTPPEQTPPPRRRRRSSGGGGSGGSGVGYHTIISSVNRAPVFTEGKAASRAVAENTAAGVNIGLAVKAADPDGDTLRYTVGGDDGHSFTVNQATGRLKTKSALDFERKSIYKVTMGVFDPKGANDTITVTIRVTDVPDVSLATPPDQIIAVVDSKRETVVSFPDGSVTITFPAGTRDTDYQVRLDRSLDNCRQDFPGQELWFCLAVDIFDNQGNLEQGVVLLRPATIRISPNVADRGGAEAVLELHGSGGVNVYTRSPSSVQWAELEFTLEANDTGGVGITIADVRTFGLYAGAIDTPEPAPEPTPTPSPTATPVPEPTPTPAPAPEPQPGPTAVVSNAPEPTPTSRPTAAVIGKSLGVMPPAPSLEDYIPTAEPEAAPEESRLKKDMGWYIALAMMGLATSIAYGGTRYVNRRRRLPLP